MTEKFDAHQALIVQAGLALQHETAAARLKNWLWVAESNVRELDNRLAATPRNSEQAALIEGQRLRAEIIFEDRKKLWYGLVGEPWPGLE